MNSLTVAGIQYPGKPKYALGMGNILYAHTYFTSFEKLFLIGENVHHAHSSIQYFVWQMSNKRTATLPKGQVTLESYFVKKIKPSGSGSITVQQDPPDVTELLLVPPPHPLLMPTPPETVELGIEVLTYMNVLSIEQIMDRYGKGGELDWKRVAEPEPGGNGNQIPGAANKRRSHKRRTYDPLWALQYEPWIIPLIVEVDGAEKVIGVLCKVCREKLKTLLASETANLMQRNQGVFVNVPFTNWAAARESLHVHEFGVVSKTKMLVQPFEFSDKQKLRMEVAKLPNLQNTHFRYYVEQLQINGEN